MKLGELKYKDMMKNPDIVCSKEVSDLYNELNKKYRYMVNMKDEYIDNLHYVACSIRNQFAELGYSEEMIADMLVQYLYEGEKRGKQLFWFCYGQYVVVNLEKNPNIKKKKHRAQKPKIAECTKLFPFIHYRFHPIPPLRQGFFVSLTLQLQYSPPKKLSAYKSLSFHLFSQTDLLSQYRRRT